MYSLTKDRNHSHFWVQGCKLWETYKTIRGLRKHFVCDVLWPDSDNLSDQDIQSIENILNGIES